MNKIFAVAAIAAAAQAKIHRRATRFQDEDMAVDYGMEEVAPSTIDLPGGFSTDLSVDEIVGWAHGLEDRYAGIVEEIEMHEENFWRDVERTIYGSDEYGDYGFSGELGEMESDIDMTIHGAMGEIGDRLGQAWEDFGMDLAG